jgi:hypothetical protein
MKTSLWHLLTQNVHSFLKRNNIVVDYDDSFPNDEIPPLEEEPWVEVPMVVHTGGNHPEAKTQTRYIAMPVLEQQTSQNEVFDTSDYYRLPAGSKICLLEDEENPGLEPQNMTLNTVIEDIFGIHNVRIVTQP